MRSPKKSSHEIDSTSNPNAFLACISALTALKSDTMSFFTTSYPVLVLVTVLGKFKAAPQSKE